MGRKRVTPPAGTYRGPHPRSPPTKEVLELTSHLPRVGYITRNPTGYVFLDLDDEWIFALQEIMEKYNYEVPPYFYGGSGVGAHVTILPAVFGEKHEDSEVDVGRKIEFKVTKVGAMFPTFRWYGTEAVYMIYIESRELDEVLKGFNEPDYDGPAYGGWHIVVGVRSLKARDQMINQNKK